MISVDHEHLRRASPDGCCHKTRLLAASCPVGWKCPFDGPVRALAVRVAQEQDIHVDRTEQGLRNLIAKGLLELRPEA